MTRMNYARPQRVRRERTDWQYRPASDKQLAFIKKLMDERPDWSEQLDDEQVERAFDVMGQKLVTGGEASTLIESLLAFPATREGEVPVAERGGPGYYTRDGEFYVVVKSRQGRLYAKQLAAHQTYSGAERFSWDYAPGVAATFAEADRVAVEQAAEWGHLHGHCFKCLKPLTDPKSVAAGIGPVCAKKVGAR